jgi:hypothetical protein
MSGREKEETKKKMMMKKNEKWKLKSKKKNKNNLRYLPQSFFPSPPSFSSSFFPLSNRRREGEK